MMIDMGLYHYKITGEREVDAASALEDRIDYLDRLPGVRYYGDELIDIIKRVALEYNVKIRVEIGI